MNAVPTREPGSVIGPLATLLLFLAVKLALLAIGPGGGASLGLALAGALEAVCWAIALSHGYRRAGAAEATLFFPLAWSAYAVVPAAVLSAGFEVFPFAERSVWTAVAMMSISASILWFGFALVFPPALALRVEGATRDLLSALCPTRMGVGLFLGVGAALTMYYAWNFVSSGAAQAVADVSRAELMGTVETGKTWLVQYVFICWTAVLILVLASPSARRQVRARWLVLAGLEAAGFLAVYLRLGNRREMFFVLVFAATVALARGKRDWVLAASAAAVPLGIVLGMARMGFQEGYEAQEAALQAFGEFVFPHYTLMDNVENATGLALGATYARLPANVVPSLGLWTKAEPLAKIFADSFAGGAMGFGYTPLAEGYLNFGVAATVIVPLLMLAALWALARRSAGSALPFLVFLAMSLDVNRGDFVGVASQYALLLVLVYGFVALIQARGAPGEAG